MQPISVICIFCEDIRIEKNEMNTLVGILPDNLNLAGVPAALPKLGIYVRINIDPSIDPGPIAITLAVPDGEPLLISTIEQSLVDSARHDATAKGAPLAGVISRTVFAPFEIPAAGRVRVLAYIKGEPVTCGSLNFQVAGKVTSAASAS